MEQDKNPFPKIDLFPRLTAIARGVGRMVSFLPTEAPDFMSDHYRGGAAMLDRELYDDPNQLQLDFEAQADKGW
jgi:hypothetical protein